MIYMQRILRPDNSTVYVHSNKNKFIHIYIARNYMNTSIYIRLS